MELYRNIITYNVELYKDLKETQGSAARKELLNIISSEIEYRISEDFLDNYDFDIEIRGTKVINKKQKKL